MSVTSPDNPPGNSAEDLPDLAPELTENGASSAAKMAAPDVDEGISTSQESLISDDIVDASTASEAAIVDDVADAPTASMPEISDDVADASIVNETVAAGEVADLPTASMPEITQDKLKQRKRRVYSKRRRAIMLVVLAVVLAGILVPAGFLIGFGINGYQTYVSLKEQAQDGVDHLLNVKTIFTGVKAHPSGFLDATKLNNSRKELSAAQKDFIQLQYRIDHTALIQTATAYFTQLQPQVQTVRAASRIGIDATGIGLELTSTALKLAPDFRGSLLTSSSKPLVTQDMLNLVGTTISQLLPQLTDIQQQSRLLSLNDLPVSAAQRDEFNQLLQLIPQIESDLEQGLNLLGAANWLLGVDSPRTFLVQTMDRAELRPTGGFTGQYGELRINGGRLGAFTLKDISLVEYIDSSETLGKTAPGPYQSWWPFANWGLRDSNLSADFPTSARMAIQQYKLEVNHNVDGVIVFTPFLIEHVLQIIGPIHVPGYNDTITAQNLEDRLHYYQQDNSGIAKQVVYQPGDTSTSDRKRFTGYLATLIMDKVRHAPPDELLAIGQDLLHDLKTKDLQVYFTNPQVENLLAQYNDAAQIDLSTAQDGLYVVQANVSASKASQFVKTILHDTVTLDAAGGATHLLQMRLVYNQIGPVYGYDTYHDYVRVYVPPGSKLLWGNGFDTGVPLCGGAYVACPQTDVYPQDQLVCPLGQYQPGAQAPSIADADGGSWHPLDTIGPPTNLISDEPGRAMFGGWVIVPKNCTMNVTLSWYVPPMSKTYSLMVQRQAGTFPELDLTILPTPGDCASKGIAAFHFDGVMGEDMSFSAPQSKAHACYPQPGI